MGLGYDQFQIRPELHGSNWVNQRGHSVQQRTYTAAEIAGRLRVGIYRAQQLCRQGKIPGAYKPLGTWLIDADEFDAWIAEAREQASA